MTNGDWFRSHPSRWSILSFLASAPSLNYSKVFLKIDQISTLLLHKTFTRRPMTRPHREVSGDYTVPGPFPFPKSTKSRPRALFRINVNLQDMIITTPKFQELPKAVSSCFCMIIYSWTVSSFIQLLSSDGILSSGLCLGLFVFLSLAGGWALNQYMECCRLTTTNN